MSLNCIFANLCRDFFLLFSRQRKKELRMSRFLRNHSISVNGSHFTCFMQFCRLQTCNFVSNLHARLISGSSAHAHTYCCIYCIRCLWASIHGQIVLLRVKNNIKIPRTITDKNNKCMWNVCDLVDYYSMKISRCGVK